MTCYERSLYLSSSDTYPLLAFHCVEILNLTKSEDIDLIGKAIGFLKTAAEIAVRNHEANVWHWWKHAMELANTLPNTPTRGRLIKELQLKIMGSDFHHNKAPLSTLLVQEEKLIPLRQLAGINK